MLCGLEIVWVYVVVGQADLERVHTACVHL